MWIYNGKFGGGGMCLNPLGLVNDGYSEITFYNDLIPIVRTLRFFMMARSGGTHIYDESQNVIRFKNMKLINKSLSTDIDPVTK